MRYAGFRVNIVAVACILLLPELAPAAPVRASVDVGERETTMWAPCLEWSIENPSFSGNPFDVVASATFTHEDTGATHTTEMFYAGTNTWAFRFTGDRLGRWSFITRSVDADLDGHRGNVTVAGNSDPGIQGFLTHVGNRFAIQCRDAEDLRGFLFNVYMNGHLVDYTDLPKLADPAVADGLMRDARHNGFDIVFLILNHNWLRLGTARHDQHNSVSPDLRTFDILDGLITQAHERGMRWHFWAWGDESRRWTPIGLPGGVNGSVDRRLQRYIAARLGPLPGWSMGYGFDLVEWTTTSGRNGWAEFLHERMGWDHLLCTRGFRLAGTRNNIVSYSGFGGRDLSTTRFGPTDYQEVVRHFEVYPDSPSFYEERHSYLRKGFKLDMDGTRRLRWWQAMAGGIGGFYGFYESSPHPYPDPEQLRTARDFWRGRFLLDMIRANGLTDGWCLRTPDAKSFVFYKEHATSIRVDLSSAPGPLPAVAVDASREYKEADLGTLGPRLQTVELPRISDWAIAVGGFDPAHADLDGSDAGLIRPKE